MTRPKTTLSGETPQNDPTASVPTNKKRPDGQHEDHWVLPAEERAKGFVRPVRETYTHVGPVLKGEFRELTEEEKKRYKDFDYVYFEPYPEDSALAGRFWTQEKVDRLGGCRKVTRMPRDIAETYARDPKYYGETFCVGCKKYLPVDEFVWEGTQRRVGS